MQAPAMARDIASVSQGRKKPRQWCDDLAGPVSN